MKKLSHLTIVFIAFVFGQFIQLFISAVAYNLYANRPVMWNGIAAGISILLVLLAYTMIRMEGEGVGAHSPAPMPTFKQEKPARTPIIFGAGSRPPLDTDPAPIENDKI